MVRKKRSRADIVYDILAALMNKGGKLKPTHLMYKANLSHTHMKVYMENLTRDGCIEKVTDKNSQFIILKEKGEKLLEKIDQMREFDSMFGI